MKDLTCNLLVIGAGPGGYVCAIRAGQLGIDTVIVEDGPLGGTCLNVGCIPSKAIIHAADEFERATQMVSGGAIGISVSAPSLDLAATMRWKDGIVGRLNGGVAALLKGAKVKTVEGKARFRDGKTVEVATPTGTQIIHVESIVIATGSEAVELKDLPFGGQIISSTEALALTQVPERLAVVGAGYVGLELGIAYRKLGAAVTIVEATDRILPLYDKDLTRPVAQRLKTLGIEVMTNARARGVASGELLVEASDGQERRIQADKILVTVGRRPSTKG
jgi:dihydrolipoamide dehydrogenase